MFNYHESRRVVFTRDSDYENRRDYRDSSSQCQFEPQCSRTIVLSCSTQVTRISCALTTTTACKLAFKSSTLSQEAVEVAKGCDVDDVGKEKAASA